MDERRQCLLSYCVASISVGSLSLPTRFTLPRSRPHLQDVLRRALKHTDVPSEIRELQRSKQSFSALAENEDWLVNNFDKIIHSQGIPPQDGDAEKRTARETVAENEERILRCLGAAVIMPWNTIALGARP